MTDDRDLAQVLLAELPRARVTVTLDVPVAEDGEYEDRGVAAWVGEAYVELPSDPDDVAGQNVWRLEDVALSRGPDPDGESEALVIAKGSGLLLDPFEASDLATLLDQTADYAHYLPAFHDAGDSGLHVDFEDLVGGVGSRVVVFDRHRLAPAWRGLGGVGRLLAARMLKWLMADAAVVLGHPAPFEVSRDEPEYDAALERVRGVWRSLGFKPWRDDIWYLDPSGIDFDEAVAALESRLHLMHA